MLKVVEEQFWSQNGELPGDLDGLAREGARRMLSVAQEVEAYVAKHAEARDERGHALVVRNGRARPRKVTVGSGTFEVEAPRVHDRRPDRKFTSRILPPWMRRRQAGCRRRASAARSGCGRPRSLPGSDEICRASTTSTCGPTACT